VDDGAGFAAIAERHHPSNMPAFEGWEPQCTLDNQPWPCDAATLLTKLRSGASRGDRHELAAFLMDALNRHGTSYGLPRDPSDLAYLLADELASRGEAATFSGEGWEHTVVNHLAGASRGEAPPAPSAQENDLRKWHGGSPTGYHSTNCKYGVAACPYPEIWRWLDEARAGGAPSSPQTPSLDPLRRVALELWQGPPWMPPAPPTDLVTPIEDELLVLFPDGGRDRIAAARIAGVVWRALADRLSGAAR
jgi:hypothetical protein